MVVTFLHLFFVSDVTFSISKNALIFNFKGKFLVGIGFTLETLAWSPTLFLNINGKQDFISFWFYFVVSNSKIKNFKDLQFLTYQHSLYAHDIVLIFWVLL